MVVIRDPRKILTHSNYHRYSNDLAYMPAYLHSEYVGTSILHELPGFLCKAYGRMRMAEGEKRRMMRKARKRRKALSDYLPKIQWFRKSYNIDKKLPV